MYTKKEIKEVFAANGFEVVSCKELINGEIRIKAKRNYNIMEKNTFPFVSLITELNKNTLFTRFVIFEHSVKIVSYIPIKNK